MIPTLSPLWRVMTRPLMTLRTQRKSSRLKLLPIAPETANLAKVFAREKFPLYDMRGLLVLVRCCGIIEQYI